MNEFIPVYQPSLSGNEKKYVIDCLDSTWISSKGKYVNAFEEKFAESINIKHATTVCNGTVAIHLALLALEIGVGDEVIVPAFTYIASVNAISYTGATPVYVESRMDSWQMDPSDIKKKVTPRTKAIMAVHLYGHPCQMDEIVSICKEKNLYLIEDCAEALATKFDGAAAGTFGDIAAFSFFGNKTITTGEGGMVTTNNRALYEKATHIKNQGVSKNVQYWHDIIGYNYRMTNIAAAIGLAQLEQIDMFVESKRRIAHFYRDNIDSSKFEFHQECDRSFHSYWMCSVLVKDGNRDSVREQLKAKGIETRPLFFPVYKMPPYFNDGLCFPIAEQIGFTGINLPSYPTLTNDQLHIIVDAVNKCI